MRCLGSGNWTATRSQECSENTCASGCVYMLQGSPSLQAADQLDQLDCARSFRRVLAEAAEHDVDHRLGRLPGDPAPTVGRSQMPAPPDLTQAQCNTAT